MGFFDDFTGSGIDFESPPGLGNAGGAISALGFASPMALQAMFLLAAMGQTPDAYQVTGKEAKKGFKQDKTAYFKTGKGTFLDLNALTQALPQLKQDYQTYQVEQFKQTYEQLSNTPGYQQLFKDAKGEFAPEFTDLVNKGYESLASQSLGAGAYSGFLSDPLKQAGILGPLALNKAQYLKGIQDQASMNAMALAGGGNVAAGLASGLGGVGGPQSYLPSTFNAAGMWQGGQQFNAQMGFNESMAKNQAAMGFGQFVAGTALGAYGMFGGGGGGGGYGGGGYSSPYGGGGLGWY